MIAIMESFNQAQVEENPKGSGKYVVKLVPSSGKNNYAIKADGSNYYAPYVRGSEINALKPSASRIQMAVKNYLSKNNTTLAQEVLKYYNEKRRYFLCDHRGAAFEE